MNSLPSDTVDDLAVETLESIAFVFGEPLEDHNHSYDRHSSIQFSGPEEDTELTVSVTDAFLADLTCNMLGIDADEVCLDKEGEEALRELANIICGEVVQALGGINTRFELGLPQSLSTPPSTDECDELVRSTIESDCGTMCISITRNAK